MELVQIRLYVRVDSEGVVGAHELESVRVVVGAGLGAGRGVARDVREHALHVGVRAERLGRHQRRRVVVLVPQLSFSPLLLVLLLDCGLVVGCGTVLW